MNKIANGEKPSLNNQMLPVTINYLRQREKEIAEEYRSGLSLSADNHDGDPSTDSVQASLRSDLTNGAALLANIRSRLIA